MKKLITSAVFGMLAARAFGQATVMFQNNVLTPIYFSEAGFSGIAASNRVNSAPLNTQDGPEGAYYGGPGVLDVGLFWSTSQFNTIGGGTLAGIENISSTAGILNGSSAFPIAGTVANELVYLQVFAWDGSYGNSVAGLNACLNAGGWFGATTADTSIYDYYGQIGPAVLVQMGAVMGPGNPIYKPTGDGGPTVLLAENPYVPEPSVLALSGLGAVALLLVRRRR